MIVEGGAVLVQSFIAQLELRLGGHDLVGDPHRFQLGSIPAEMDLVGIGHTGAVFNNGDRHGHVVGRLTGNEDHAVVVQRYAGNVGGIHLPGQVADDLLIVLVYHHRGVGHAGVLELPVGGRRHHGRIAAAVPGEENVIGLFIGAEADQMVLVGGDDAVLIVAHCDLGLVFQAVQSEQAAPGILDGDGARRGSGRLVHGPSVAAFIGGRAHGIAVLVQPAHRKLGGAHDLAQVILSDLQVGQLASQVVNGQVDKAGNGVRHTVHGHGQLGDDPDMVLFGRAGGNHYAVAGLVVVVRQFHKRDGIGQFPVELSVVGLRQADGIAFGILGTGAVVLVVHHQADRNGGVVAAGLGHVHEQAVRCIGDGFLTRGICREAAEVGNELDTAGHGLSAKADDGRGGIDDLAVVRHADADLDSILFLHNIRLVPVHHAGGADAYDGVQLLFGHAVRIQPFLVEIPVQQAPLHVPHARGGIHGLAVVIQGRPLQFKAGLVIGHRLCIHPGAGKGALAMTGEEVGGTGNDAGAVAGPDRDHGIPGRRAGNGDQAALRNRHAQNGGIQLPDEAGVHFLAVLIQRRGHKLHLGALFRTVQVRRNLQVKAVGLASDGLYLNAGKTLGPAHLKQFAVCNTGTRVGGNGKLIAGNGIVQRQFAVGHGNALGDRPRQAPLDMARKCHFFIILVVELGLQRNILGVGGHLGDLAVFLYRLNRHSGKDRGLSGNEDLLGLGGQGFALPRRGIAGGQGGLQRKTGQLGGLFRHGQHAAGKAHAGTRRVCGQIQLVLVLSLENHAGAFG